MAVPHLFILSSMDGHLGSFLPHLILTATPEVHRLPLLYRLKSEVERDYATRKAMFMLIG